MKNTTKYDYFEPFYKKYETFIDRIDNKLNAFKI